MWVSSSGWKVAAARSLRRSAFTDIAVAVAAAAVPGPDPDPDLIPTPVPSRPRRAGTAPE